MMVKIIHTVEIEKKLGVTIKRWRVIKVKLFFITLLVIKHDVDH